MGPALIDFLLTEAVTWRVNHWINHIVKLKLSATTITYNPESFFTHSPIWDMWPVASQELSQSIIFARRTEMPNIFIKILFLIYPYSICFREKSEIELNSTAQKWICRYCDCFMLEGVEQILLLARVSEFALEENLTPSPPNLHGWFSSQPEIQCTHTNDWKTSQTDQGIVLLNCR